MIGNRCCRHVCAEQRFFVEGINGNLKFIPLNLLDIFLGVPVTSMFGMQVTGKPLSAAKLYEVSLQSIYKSQIAEATLRLLAAKRYLLLFNTTGDVPDLEAAILQVRKALETIAFAAIAPDIKQYEAFRAEATKNPDFTKDYHAAKIFTALSLVNKDFYPISLLPVKQQHDGSWHFDIKQSGFLTKKKFETVYDRLGKHLHAHNPWSGSKNLQNLAGDLPTIVEETHALLDVHARIIRTSEFHGVWVIETDRLGNPPQILTAKADGPFIRINS